MRRGWVRLAASAAIFGVLVWRLGTGPFLDGVRTVDGRALAAAAGLALVTTVACAWRWKIVASGLGVPPNIPNPGAPPGTSQATQAADKGSQQAMQMMMQMGQMAMQLPQQIGGMLTQAPQQLMQPLQQIMQPLQQLMSAGGKGGAPSAAKCLRSSSRNGMCSLQLAWRLRNMATLKRVAQRLPQKR